MTTVRSRLLARGGERLALLDLRPRTRQALLSVLPAALVRRFDPAAAGDLHAVFRLEVTDPRGGPPTPIALSVERGACRVIPNTAEAAGASVTVSAGDVIRLASGTVQWPELMASRRLTLGGDPFLALRFPGLFGLTAG